MSIGGAISDVLGTENLGFDQLKVLFNFGNIIKHGKKTKDGTIGVRVDKVLPESSKNPYMYMISDVFGTLFILKILL